MLFRESHHPLRMCCEWVKRNLPNMVFEPRTEPKWLGCDGIARYSDRVSIDHFLSELDKACCREKQVNKGGNT